MGRIFNFSAGPAILPEPVLAQAADAVREFAGSGMSLLEMSHRDKRYDVIHEKVRTGVVETLGLSSDDYDCLFMGGGASTQFSLVPMNLLTQGHSGAYVDGGEWGAKAIESARFHGDVDVVGSSKADNHSRLPVIGAIPERAAYVHITTNNTIEGTQMAKLPSMSVPLVGDLSSDIFGRVRDNARFDLMYAGAQKNAGPAGVTLVIIRKSLLAQCNPLPPMFSYKVQADKHSVYNTPPVFPIYVVGLVLDWIAAEGGVTAVAERNERKARLIYNAIDASAPVFSAAVPDPADRSWMNITFRLASKELETEFLAEAKANGMDGLPGHRNVGGCRASIYNAFPEAGCKALADLISDFAVRKG
ncbi:MAG: 3-phosphoserine/phosphohydroxythreonine transaminase [Armatimonadaceae bacterium]|jgi:phosphoserine aminotransferase